MLLQNAPRETGKWDQVDIGQQIDGNSLTDLKILIFSPLATKTRFHFFLFMKYADGRSEHSVYWRN